MIGILTNNELEDLQESGRGLIEVLSRYFLKRPMNNMDNICQKMAVMWVLQLLTKS
jgi:hypothetical protein